MQKNKSKKCKGWFLLLGLRLTLTIRGYGDQIKMKKISSRAPWEPPLIVIIVLCSVLILSVHLGLAPLNKAEGRIAEVVREMLIRGDYFHPTCLWVPYTTKPLLPYWLIICFYKLRPVLDEFTLRFPSALFAAFSVLSTFLLGKRLFSTKTALLGSLILSTCYGVITWGRCAAADILNMSAIIIAISYYWLNRERSSFPHAVILGVLIALSGQMKGLVGIAIPIGLIAIDIFLSGRLGQFFAPRLLAGFFIGLFAYFLPFLPALSGHNLSGYHWLSMAVHESITRAIRPFDHKGSPFTYVEFIPLWLIPWSIILFGMLGYYFLNIKRLAYEARWLLLCFAFIFLLFTLAGSRRSYYILPILPFASLIAGSFLEFQNDGQRFLKYIIRAQLLFFLLLSVILIVSPVVAHHRKVPLPIDFFYILALEGMIILLLTLYPLIKGRGRFLSRQEIISMCTVGFVIASGFILFEKPFFDKKETEKPFILNVKKYVEDKIPRRKDSFFYYKIGPRTRARLSFYLNRSFPIRNLQGLQELQKRLSKSGFIFLVTERVDMEKLGNYLFKRSSKDHISFSTIFCQKLHGFEGWPYNRKRHEESRLCFIEISVS